MNISPHHRALNAAAEGVFTEISLPVEASNSNPFNAMLQTCVFTIEERALMEIGVVLDGDAIYVDKFSGEVASESAEVGELWHVNATLCQFSNCLDLVESSFPLYLHSAGLAAFAEAERRMWRRLLEEVDDSALDETGRFWDVFLHDIGLGDYA